MKRFEVTAGELAKYVSEIEVELAGHFGQGWHISVKFDVGSREYRVYDHRHLVVSTPSPELAAESFNSLRPRMEGTQT